MEYINNQNGNGGYIVGQEDDQEIGRLTYTLDPDTNSINITYVMVFPQYKGKGYGKELVKEATKWAKENQWKIIPICPFAGKILDRMDGIDDLYTK